MIGVDARIGRRLDSLSHLHQSIRDILTTRRGTRVMRRDYGSRLPDLVDNPITPKLAMELYAATAEALDKWEPRLRLTRIKIAAAEVGRVMLDLEGVYLPDGDDITLSGVEVAT